MTFRNPKRPQNHTFLWPNDLPEPQTATKPPLFVAKSPSGTSNGHKTHHFCGQMTFRNLKRPQNHPFLWPNRLPNHQTATKPPLFVAKLPSEPPNGHKTNPFCGQITFRNPKRPQNQPFLWPNCLPNLQTATKPTLFVAKPPYGTLNMYAK